MKLPLPKVVWLLGPGLAPLRCWALVPLHRRIVQLKRAALSGNWNHTGHLSAMTEYERRSSLPSASYAQFCLELLAFVAVHSALHDASRSEQLSAWMADAAESNRSSDATAA